MIFKNMDGDLKSELEYSEADTALFAAVAEGISGLRTAFDALDFSTGLEAWMRGVFACNQYVDEQAPWALRKSDPARMETVLMTLFRVVRDLALAVRPVVPTAIDALLDQMGQGADARNYAALAEAGWFDELVASGFKVDKPQGVFPRLELPEEAAA
jgi:methionyl-tRNA synthetase